jgi:hypothetical protein
MEDDMQRFPKRNAQTLAWMMNDDDIWNSWVVSGPLEFYVRKGHITTVQRNVSVIKPCLMVANLNTGRGGSHPGKRTGFQMLAFMREVEANAVRYGYNGVFVECVYNTRLHRPLMRGGYRRLRAYSQTAPCFFKPAAGMRSTQRAAAPGIWKLDRPSLRRFLSTPDIERYWLHDQAENVLLLVRRERQATLAAADGMRLTVLDLHRHKIGTGDERTGHALCWSDDAACIVRLLRKLETRLAQAGFRELALAWQVTDLSIQSGRDSTTAGANAAAAAPYLHELGYVEARDGNGGLIHIKPLSA